MKIIVILFFILFSLFSCTEVENESKQEIILIKSNQTLNGYVIYIMEFDSCEYLTSGTGNSQMMAHKGNCKYCLKRNSSK